MNKLQISIKNKINSMRCAEHNQQPDVKISGDKINFDCCCDSLKENIKKVIAKATKDYVESELRNALDGR
jgi:hypothetical protein